MKKHLLFTNDTLAEEYYVFQGDYDSPGEAFCSACGQAADGGKLCVYKIVSHVSMRCEEEGFINPPALQTSGREAITINGLCPPRAEELPSTIALRSGLKQVAKCEVS